MSASTSTRRNTVPQVTSCGLVTDTVEVSEERTQRVETGELEKIRAGKAVTTTENSGVVRIAQYPEMACFLVRDFPLGRRPHKAIPQVVGQRGLSKSLQSKSKALGRCAAFCSGCFGVQGTARPVV